MSDEWTTDEPESALSQTDVVIQGIKDMIIRGELGPGDRLPIERELAQNFGVSRGPLREGVRALVLLGVLGTRRGSGTYVTALDATRLLSPVGFLADLYQPASASHLSAVRRVLEVEAVGHAATAVDDTELDVLTAILDSIDRELADEVNGDLEAVIDADNRFHATIARAGGNPVLAALVEGLVSRTFRSRLWRAIHERGANRETQQEHRAILDALRRRDADAARIRMAGHLLAVEQSVKHQDDDSSDHMAPSGKE
jgi:GntR family transcriptional regulator, transcriptional repressor for pyruvate dehydrogenase complex